LKKYPTIKRFYKRGTYKGGSGCYPIWVAGFFIVHKDIPRPSFMNLQSLPIRRRLSNRWTWLSRTELIERILWRVTSVRFILGR
jgi:hypothetical protein